ncbi:uncharacterized protein LOC115059243 [Echeneis naucrates]|uniref:uncharacterized protein LOC115059243 n=1 Tax=Echeneis naucrates TaxID=173247 RepID=UPI001114226E|nr:uncharacterized protein LOC115059243 [Echeneis naucrates]
MWVNSSSSVRPVILCMDHTEAVTIIVASIVCRVLLLLPLSSVVLYLGQQRSAAWSHSDVFTFHMAAMDLLYILGGVLFAGGLFYGVLVLVKLGLYFTSFVYPGQILFHTLTCVERYLAAAHPVAYLGLRQSGGVRIRNISIGCVWLLCLGWIPLAALSYPQLPYIPYICLLTFSLVVSCFCSVCILRVLIRPGPGHMGGARVQVDQSKQRASYTVSVIMGVLGLWFCGFILCFALRSSGLLDSGAWCMLLASVNWLTLPSSLVLPLLFLQRAGKLRCCHGSWITSVKSV